MKKILSILVGLLLLLIAAVVVMTLVAPTEFAVEREIEINKPKAEVFDYMRNLKNQEKWSAWAKKDPNSKMTYTGTDGQVGSVAAWDSDHPEVGKGEQEIKKIDEGKRIDVEMRFKEPFESSSDGYTAFESVGEDKTKVRWGFSGAMPRPFNIMMLFMDMEGAVGKDFDEGLGNLKTLLENQPSSSTESDDSEAETESKDDETQEDKEKKE